MILEVNDAGEIVIPAELVRSAPHARVEAEREGNSLVLKPVDSPSTHAGCDLLAALPVIAGHLVDRDFTFRREDLYADPDAG